MKTSILGKLTIVSTVLSAFTASAYAASAPTCYTANVGRTNYAVKITSSNSYYAGSQVSWLEMTTTERGRTYSNVAMANGDAIRELKRYGVVDFSGENDGGYMTVSATSRNSILITGRVGSSFQLYDADPYSDSFDPYVSSWATPTRALTLYKTTCVKYSRYYRQTSWNTYRNYGQHGPRRPHRGPYNTPGHHVPQYPTHPTYPSYPTYPTYPSNPGHNGPGHNSPGNHNPGHHVPNPQPTYNPGHQGPSHGNQGPSHGNNGNGPRGNGPRGGRR